MLEPLETIKSTLFPRSRLLPAVGFVAITRPFFISSDCRLIIFPTCKPAASSLLSAAFSAILVTSGILTSCRLFPVPLKAKIIIKMIKPAAIIEISHHHL